MPKQRFRESSFSSDTNSDSDYSTSETEKDWQPQPKTNTAKYKSSDNYKTQQRGYQNYKYDSVPEIDLEELDIPERNHVFDSSNRSADAIGPAGDMHSPETINISKQPLKKSSTSGLMSTSKLVLLHLFSTILIYLLVYPLINGIWSYFVSVYGEMATLLKHVVEEPAYDLELRQHFQKMRWLSWPPVTAESVSLLLASTIKDHLYFRRYT